MEIVYNLREDEHNVTALKIAEALIEDSSIGRLKEIIGYLSVYVENNPEGSAYDQRLQTLREQ